MSGLSQCRSVVVLARGPGCRSWGLGVGRGAGVSVLGQGVGRGDGVSVRGAELSGDLYLHLSIGL